MLATNSGATKIGDDMLILFTTHDTTEQHFLGTKFELRLSENNRFGIACGKEMLTDSVFIIHVP